MAGNPENLVPNTALTPEELRARNSKAGIASGKARREKKLWAEYWTDVLNKKYDITIEGKKQKISGYELAGKTFLKIMARGDSSSVSLLREMREAMEGNKINLAGSDGGPLDMVINILPVKSKE